MAYKHPLARDRRTAAVVALDRIQAHPHNIRKDLGDLTELAKSIRRRGVMVPVILEQRGETLRIRDGHRRVAAAELAGLDRIPAFVHSVALPDPEWALQAVEVNEQRRGLDPAERRANIERLRELGWSNADIGEAYGVSAYTISRWAHWQPEPEPEPAGGAAAPPKRNRSGQQARTVGKRVLRGLVEDWRDQLPAGFLDALEELIAVKEAGS